MNQAESTLTKPKMYNLLKLQQLFYNKFLTVQLLHQLVSLYTCCIQSIDQKQSDLRIYFLQKIQFVLSRNQVQSLLNSINVSQRNDVKEKIVENLRQTYRMTTQRAQIQLQDQTPIQAPNFDRKKLYIYDGDNPNEKKKKIDIQLQLMKQMQQNMKNINSQVQAANKKQQNQNNLIKNITKQQNNKLEQRLAKRKRKIRKQSVDIQEKNQDQGHKIKIDKSQFIKSQQQINQAIVRITVRATQRKISQQQSNTNERKQGYVKGKIKKGKNDDFID